MMQVRLTQAELTESTPGASEKPMPNQPPAGPNMSNVMLLLVTVQDTVQGVPSKV